MTEIWKQVTVVGLAIACFSIAQSLHGSGYIAAFTGGLLFGFKAKDATHKLVRTTRPGHSLVFAIIVVNEGVAGGGFIAMVVVLTVFLSLVAHGVSANPLAKLWKPHP